MRAMHCGTFEGTPSRRNMENNTVSEEQICSGNDIPGAGLCKPVEQCSVAILKRWLSCRGAKVTGTKPELMKRYSVNFAFRYLYY